MDIVPVDYVADALVHLLDRREAGVFNLVAGRNAATVDELTTLASEYFGKPVPPFVDPVDPDSDDHDSVYVPYFDMRVVFDDARARSVLVPAGIEAPPLREYFPKLMEYAAGRALGQAEDDARGRSRPARGARGHVSSKTHEPGYSADQNRGE